MLHHLQYLCSQFHPKNIYFTFEMPKNGPHGPTTSAVQTSNWFDVDPTIKRICDSTYLHKKFVFLKMLHNINLSSTRSLIRKKNIDLCKKIQNWWFEIFWDVIWQIILQGKIFLLRFLNFWVTCAIKFCKKYLRNYMV